MTKIYKSEGRRSNTDRIINISYTAPDLPCPMVSRPHLIQTLVQIFDSNTEIVCVEGQQGYGKTTLLREFAETVDSGDCFGVFLKPTSRLSYDSVLARSDMTNQVYWFLNSENQPDDSELTDGELRNLWNKCARKLNRGRRRGYIIVDGIHHIPPEEEFIKQAIMNLLPFGVKPFKFLFSGDISKDIFFDNKKLRVKTFTISTFAPNETNEYLQDLIKDKDLRSRYHSVSGGVPMLLESVRRLVANSADPKNETDIDSAKDIESLFEAGWNLCEPFSDEIKKVLAFIVAHGIPVDSQDLSKKCSMSKTEIEKVLGSLPFLKFSGKPPGWEFSSELFRGFAEKKLSKSVKSVIEDIISSLLEDPDSYDSLTQLPLYLEKTGSTENVLEWLSEDRLADILLKTKTVAGIEPTLHKAIQIYHGRKNDRDLTTYSLLRSIIQQISQKTTGIEHEIRARGALGDFDGALAVANNVPLFTQRLRLLAVLAASFSDSPGFPVQPLIEQIRESLKHVNINDLPREEAIDIITDLHPVDEKLALNLLREITQSDIEDSSFEVAVARTRLDAIYSKAMGEPRKDGHEKHSVSKDIVVDQKLRRLLEADQVFYHAKSADEVLDATRSIEDPSERLFIQRKWVFQNPLQDDVLDVVETAINDAIAISEFTPNATFYREISTPLPYSRHKERRRKVVAILDGQESIIKRKGPTVDYVRLQLHLAECDYVDEELLEAATRLENLYFSVESVDELETRITCLAWFASELHKFDPRERMKNHIDVKEQVNDELEKTLSSILKDCANQFQIVSGAVEALAIYLPETALAIARQLNIVERRNAAFLHIITAMCNSNSETPDNSMLFEILDEIEPGPESDYATEKINKRLCQDIEEENKPVSLLGKDILCRLDKCSSAATRAECLANLATTAKKCSGSEALCSSISKKLLEEFESIASPREKYQVACQLIAILRATCPDLAEKIFEYLKNPSLKIAPSENIEQGLFYMLNLLTKAAGALAQSNILRDTDIQKTCQMIERIQYPYLKINLFSTLAFFLWREKQFSFFSKIVNQQICPMLSRLTGKDHALSHGAWIKAYPVVWLEDRDRARKAIKAFPAAVRNECVSALSSALLNKQPPGEPFDNDPHNINTSEPLDYPDIRNLLHLCEETDEDFTILTVFESIASKVTAKQSETTLTREQKTEITRLMLEISEKKLPIKHRIQHAGFQILCKAQALRISEPPNPRWDDLIKEGETLTNAADRVYVLAHIAPCLPSKKRKQSKRLFETAEREAGNLRSMEDKYGHHYMIAMLSKNREQSLRVLKEAFGTVAKTGSRHKAIKENLIVDLAHKLDPELPMQLALLYDDDPAREGYKKRAQKQLNMLQLKKDLGNIRKSLTVQEKRSATDLPSATWNALGALNSGRMVAVNMVRLREMLARAGSYPLNESYPMYSWALSNVMLKYSGTPESQRYIRDIFEGMLRGVKFLFLISEADGKLSFHPEWQDLGDDSNQIFVHAGERIKALKFLQSWLQENAEEQVTIVDPYFSPEDLEIVLQVMKTDPQLEVRILTGKSSQKNIDGNLSDAYSYSWRCLCDQSPPYTEIFVVGSEKTGDAPFHDRWILSKSMGLSLGTSLNSLGNKDSAIRVLGSAEVMQVHSTIERYYKKQVREFNGDHVAYESFELLA